MAKEKSFSIVLPQKLKLKLLLSVCVRAKTKYFTIGRYHRNRQRKAPGRKYPHLKMGQESSSLVDEKVSPETLSERSLDAVASLIRNGRARKIVVMVSTVPS